MSPHQLFDLSGQVAVVTGAAQGLCRSQRNGCRVNSERHSSTEGGTITLSNLGAYGIDNFTPVINYPEISILGRGAIRLEPAATSDGRIELRHQMALSLTIADCRSLGLRFKLLGSACCTAYYGSLTGPWVSALPF